MRRSSISLPCRITGCAHGQVNSSSACVPRHGQEPARLVPPSTPIPAQPGHRHPLRAPGQLPGRAPGRCSRTASTVYANPFSALCYARDRASVPVARPAEGEMTRPSWSPGRCRARRAAHRQRHRQARHPRPGPAGAAPRRPRRGLGGFPLSATTSTLPRRCCRTRLIWASCSARRWSGMSALTRDQLQVVGESATAPPSTASWWRRRPDKREAIQRIPAPCTQDPAGIQVLDDLPARFWNPRRDPPRRWPSLIGARPAGAQGALVGLAMIWRTTPCTASSKPAVVGVTGACLSSKRWR